MLDCGETQSYRTGWLFSIAWQPDFWYDSQLLLAWWRVIKHYSKHTYRVSNCLLKMRRLVKTFPLGGPEGFLFSFQLLLPAAQLPPSDSRGSEASVWAWWLVTETFGTYGKFDQVSKLIIILFEKKGEETEATCFFWTPVLRPRMLPWMVICVSWTCGHYIEPLVDCFMGCSFSHWVIS